MRWYGFSWPLVEADFFAGKNKKLTFQVFLPNYLYDVIMGDSIDFHWCLLYDLVFSSLLNLFL